MDHRTSKLDSERASQILMNIGALLPGGTA